MDVARIHMILLFVAALLLDGIECRKVTVWVADSKYKANEGGYLAIHCTADADVLPAPADVVFKFINNNPVQSVGHITVNQSTDGPLNKSATLILNPVQLSDHSGYHCLSGSASAFFEIAVLPKENVPEINFSTNIGKTVGSETSLDCNAAINVTGSGIGVAMALVWKFTQDMNIPGGDISSEAKTVESQSGGKKMISSNLLRIVGTDTGGFYTCLVTVTKNSEPFPFERNATIYLPVMLGVGVSAKQEIKLYKGKSAKLMCEITGFPEASVTWKRQDKPITAATDKRFVFSNYKTSKNAILEISNVDYSDRSVYTCNASNPSTWLTIAVTLRVRDPLGALWPFIGIVIEAIVLAVIIIGYEKFKTKHGKHGKGKKQKLETSPLLSKSDDVGVEYTAGSKARDDSVRMRSTEEIQA